MVTCEKTKESYDKETDFNEKKRTCKMQNFYILIHEKSYENILAYNISYKSLI